MSAEEAAGQNCQHEDNTKLFQELDSYPWDKDAEFQGGLSAILGPSSTPSSRIEDLTLRARCFYYTRKKNLSQPVDFEAYRTWHKSHHPESSPSSATPPTVPSHTSIPPLSEPSLAYNPDSQSLSTSTNTSLSDHNDPDNPPYPTSFAALVELITSGAPIPGIKDIPPTLLTSQATAPVAAKRRKPWETEGHVIEKIEDGEGTFGDARDRIVVQEFPDDDDSVAKHHVDNQHDELKSQSEA